MLLYHFFDYKYFIEGFSSDLFSVPHIIYIVLAYVSCVLFAVLFRNASHKRIEIFLKILSLIVLALEVVKITWESYFDITTGRGFNWGGILPLYTCSLFIYTLLIAAWGKGKAREMSLSFIATISMVSGAIGVVQCNGLNWYPFWTFGAWYSLMFHYLMFAVGILILATRYKVVGWKDIYIAWIPMVILSVIAGPANYAYGADYMQIYEGSGIPLFSTLAEKMAEVNLRPLFTIIMLSAYMILSALVVSVCKLIGYLCKKAEQKKSAKQEPIKTEAK